MRFKVKDIDEDGVDVDLTLGAAWFAEVCAGAEAKPAPEGLKVKAHLMQAGSDYLLRGHMSGEMIAPCSRCLEPARVTIGVPLGITFMERSRRSAHDRNAAHDEDDDAEADVDVATFQGDEIDVGPELKDEILLAMPMTPLCRDACAGLCPVCGGNRNQNPCNCAELQKITGSAFAGISKLKV